MSKELIYLNDTNFYDAIESGITLVDFYADWCGPCRMIAPIIEELAVELQKKAKIAKVDIENAQSVAEEYQVTSIPTIILFVNGKETKRVVGVKDKPFLLNMIEEASKL